jgi:hypothetical protein
VIKLRAAPVSMDLRPGGDDHIYGDSEFNVDLTNLVYLIRNPLADDREALLVVVGPSASSDLIPRR